MNNIEQGMKSDWPESIVVYTDGASRGNPGPASVGVSVQGPDGAVIYEYGAALGAKTNNFAEYTAVEMALKLAVENGVDNVTLRSDSQLLIRQLLGQYKVKSSSLRPIYESCLELVQEIGHVNFEHVPREENRRADELANFALDGRDI